MFKGRAVSVALACVGLALAGFPGVAPARPLTVATTATSNLHPHGMPCGRERRRLARAHETAVRRQARTRLGRCQARWRRLHSATKPPAHTVTPPTVVPPVVPHVDSPVSPPVDPPAEGPPAVVPPAEPPIDPPADPPLGDPTIFYDDAFPGTSLDPFWNASSAGVTVAGGEVTIPAGGAYLGTNQKLLGNLPGFSRDLIVHVISGDGPGVTLYNRDVGGEVLDFSAHDGAFDVWVDATIHAGSWSYPPGDTWWDVHTDGTHISIATSPDGVTWTTAGTRTAALAGGVSIVRITSAGNTIGHGSSTLPTVIDHLTWWDDVLDAPVATDLTTPVLDDGQRADEPLIGHGWLSPGFPDHSAMQLLGHRILGVSDAFSNIADNGAIIHPTAFGPASEAWGQVAGPAAPATEYTLFAALGADLSHKAGYDCWTNGDKLYAGRFDPPFSFYYLIPGIPLPGGALAPGDRLGLVVRNSTVSVAVQRVGQNWKTIAHVYDPTYTSGQTGYALIDHNGVSGAWSAVGGGTIAP